MSGQPEPIVGPCCGDCFFGLGLNTPSYLVQCRRFPPANGAHPLTRADGWCGEHRTIIEPLDPTWKTP